MVSISNIVTGAILLGGLSAFLGLGGFKGIGSKLGQGFGEFGTSLISGITGAFPKVSTAIDGKAPITEVIETLDVGNIVTGASSSAAPRLATAKEKGLLALAGFVQSERLGGTINLETGIFTSSVGKQPLGFTITKTGGIRTGTTGLGAGVIEKQKQLAKQFGIPTFDVTGAISAFGGVSSGGGQTGGGGGRTGGSSSGSISTGRFSGHGTGGFRG
jgi:hypothetical protein